MEKMYKTALAAYTLLAAHEDEAHHEPAERMPVLVEECPHCVEQWAHDHEPPRFAEAQLAALYEAYNDAAKLTVARTGKTMPEALYTAEALRDRELDGAWETVALRTRMAEKALRLKR